ncbi:hypothetical protein E2C01_089138 [Portunus trituberculatus]|uniref:Uncharacterized protein n=1 Tax=Portunus trituberculatus TaxID=210409 RepID=A0A5B7JLP2_PORTR|nr:hypothetical protein [Portunus trituberculatus]
MAVVSALAAKVVNLTATVSGHSNEFAAFKNQQHTVCSGTSTVAPTPSPASGAQWGQGESDPVRPTQEKGQCWRAMCNCRCTLTEDGCPPPKPVKKATRQPRSPSGMTPASPASESKSHEADCDEDAAGEWTLVSRKKKRCSSPISARTASPEPDLAWEVDGLKTQMQHHHNEW